MVRKQYKRGYGEVTISEKLGGEEESGVDEGIKNLIKKRGSQDLRKEKQIAKKSS